MLRRAVQARRNEISLFPPCEPTGPCPRRRSAWRRCTPRHTRARRTIRPGPACPLAAVIGKLPIPCCAPALKACVTVEVRGRAGRCLRAQERGAAFSAPRPVHRSSLGKPIYAYQYPTTVARKQLELGSAGRQNRGRYLDTSRLLVVAGALGLRRVPNQSVPSEQEKVVAAKTAPARFEEPVESPLHGISGAYAPEIDGSAIGTACREQPHRGADHDSVSAFGVRTDGVK